MYLSTTLCPTKADVSVSKSSPTLAPSTATEKFCSFPISLIKFTNSSPTVFLPSAGRIRSRMSGKEALKVSNNCKASKDERKPECQKKEM